MAAEQVVTELIIDASDVARAERLVTGAFDHMGDRALAAQAKFDASMQAQMQIYGRSLPQALSRVEDAYARLQGRIDPVIAVQQRLEREMVQSLGVINRAVLLGVTTERQAAQDIARLKQQQIEQINRVRDAQLAANAANDNVAGGGAQFRRQNLGFQLQDIGVSLYGGMPIATVLLQQGSQIAGVYAGNGGANAAIKDFVSILGSVARVAGPAIAVGAALYGAYRLLASYSREAALAVDSSTAALAAQAAPASSAKSGIQELASLQDAYRLAILSTADAQETATSGIISALNREFGARKALLELELLRQEAAIKTQQAEMAITGLQLQRDLGRQVMTRSDLERQGFADPRIGSVPFVRLPDDLTGLEKTQDLIDNSPLAAKIKELRANLTLTELAAEQLRKALRATFADGTLLPGGANSSNPGELRDPLTGRTFGNLPVPQLRGIDDQPGSADYYREITRSAATRLRQMEAEANLLGITGAAAASLRFEQDALNDAVARGIELSPQQRAGLKEMADAFGLVTEKLARSRVLEDASFRVAQAGRNPVDQEIASTLRGAGLAIDLDSADAAAIRHAINVEKIADAWRDVRDTGMDAVDTLVDSALNGFSDIEDAAKSIAGDILKEFATLAISNPIKNGLFGADLPTLDGLGGIGGFFKTLIGGENPAARAVTDMMVTAAVVNINGAPIGAGVGDAATRLLSGANGNDPWSGARMGAPVGAVGRSSPSQGNPAGTWGDMAGASARTQLSGSRQDFVNMLMPAAMEASARTGIDPRIIVAQAAQETGWGRSAPGNNYFGIKSHGVSGGQTFTTHEVINGQRVRIQDSFRRFASPADSVEGYADFMLRNPRYTAMREANGLDAQLSALGRSGYATDPNYANSVGAIAKSLGSIERLGTSATETGRGLDMVATKSMDVGAGFDQFGKSLASSMTGAPAAPGVGGGGGLLSWLFGGGGAAPASTGFMTSPRAYASGTEFAPPGWAWVGEEGPELMRMRGGETIRNARASQQMASPTVNVVTNVHNNAGVQIREERKDDGKGGIRQDIYVEKAVARAMSRPGSEANQTLSQMGARAPLVRR